eukprot:4316485-Prymnesium_polylepis.1
MWRWDGVRWWSTATGGGCCCCCCWWWWSSSAVTGVCVHVCAAAVRVCDARARAAYRVPTLAA